MFGLIGLSLFMYRGDFNKYKKISYKNLFLISLITISMFFGEYCAWNSLRKCDKPGLNKISTILEISLVLFISFYFFKKKLSERQILGMALAFLSIYLIIVDK